MKILCKVLPDDNTCCCCIADQWDGHKEHLECSDCIERMPDYEVLQFGHSLFGVDWAMVLGDDGNVERVSLKRVKRVRTIHTQTGIELDNFAANMKKLGNTLR